MRHAMTFLPPARWLPRAARRLAAILGLSLLALSATPTQAGQVLDRVRANETMRVCIWPDYDGVSLRNPRTQQLEGIDIDLSQALAQDLKLKLQHVDSSFPTLIADLEGDRCDVAMYAIGMLPQQAERLAFTRPYLQSDIYGVTTKGNKAVSRWEDIDQPGVAVAVQAGTFMEPVMQAALKQARLVKVSAPATRERELEAGRVDVFMTDFPYSRRLLDNADWAMLVSPPKPFSVLPYAYAVKRGDAMGRCPQDWVTETDRPAVQTLFDPDSGQGVRHLRAALVDSHGLPRTFQWSVMPLQVNGRVVGFAGSAVDISEQVQAQRQLENQLHFSELLLESSPLPMSVFDRSRCYLSVNRAWENFTGRSRASVIGKEVGSHLGAEERAIHEARDQLVYGSNGAVRYDVQLLHADGSHRDAVVEKRALPDADGQAAGILAVIIDVTEFREAERATREARDAAEESSRAKSEFIANISHELRTPLQSIIGFSELGMRRAGDHERLATMFGEVHGSGGRMLSPVNDLLDVARMESTVGMIHLERIDLRGLVREVMRELAPLAQQRRLQLALGLPGQSMRAKVDSLRLKQVVRNLVANAIKFSHEGGSIETRGEIEANGQLHLCVADHGPGIPEAELERIFEAFVPSSQTKDGSGGSGLGLTICRKIVEAHQGRIEACQRSGGGAEFHVRLPGRAPADTGLLPL